ncbi:NmrA family NAD(P)-binding protein, partial [Marinilabilia sp.]
MNKTLITGATGNIGFEVIRFLYKMNTPNKIIAGVRNIRKAEKKFSDFPELEYAHFDFEDFDTFDNALSNIDRVFLLRPPHISDVEKHFKPLISKIKDRNIREILFLSVQGAEKSKVIPHNQIERLIKDHELNYIFLRPSYFMQNLTTTLLYDIQSKGEIILPAGKVKFNWIDIENIGETAAILLEKFANYKNRAIEIT